jgi:hypothetical protein
MPKPKDGGESTKSSSKSFKTLASKANATVKTIKRKAVEILSPGKKKKAKQVPVHGITDAETPSSQPASEVSSQHSATSILDVPDEETHNDELSKWWTDK